MRGNLPKPIKKQREVLYMPSAGHSAVLGTAGSGKMTLALYRAAYLSEPSMPHAGRTLLLTLNKTLVTYLKYLKPIELQNVQVETYHTFALGDQKSRKGSRKGSRFGFFSENSFTADHEAMSVFFRFNSFASDVVKINVEQSFRQFSPVTEVKSL